MRPSPTIQELSSCEPLLVFRHDEDLGAQLRPFLYTRGLIPTIYWISNLVSLLFLLLLTFQHRPISYGITYAFTGIGFGYLLLLPLHESLHALTYRLLGFSQVSVVYLLRSLTAFCVADKQVLDSNQFRLVCLAPSVVINPILILAIGLTRGVPQILFAGALFLHVAAASGDLALVNVLRIHKTHRLYTYDEVELKTTRFVIWPEPF